MNCKFCNAEVSQEDKICPVCGKALWESAPETAEEVPASEQTAEEIPAADLTAEQEMPEQKKKKVWPLVLAIVGAVAALAVLACVLLVALGVDIKPRPNDIFKKDSYTVSDSKAEQKADKVIAVIGDKELTNSQLMFYYKSQLIDFVNYYGSYLSMIGMDINKPLSEQPCYFEAYEDYSWQQYFLEMAIKTWENYQLMGILAEQDGFVLSEDSQKVLEEFPKNLEEQAEKGEYDSVDAMIADTIGVGCDLEGYMSFVRLAYISGEYHAQLSGKLNPAQEDVEAYFDKNVDSFKENGITKESGLYSAVRHILISPEGGTTDETTKQKTYSDAEWAACLAKAESVLQEWKDGEATAESFGKLASIYTADTASASTGGLYEGICKGSGMVAEFEAWAIDPARKSGDTGIVKTQFGYHIMYFVSGEQNWMRSARVNLLAERTTELLEDAAEQWPITVKYNKIAMGELKVS